MPMVRVPHSGDNEGFSVISEGVYDIKITTVEFREPTQQGRPAKLMVQGLIKGSSNGKHADKKVTLWLGFDQSWRIEHLLKATDVDYDRVAGPQGQGEQMAFDTDHLLGKFFQARLTHGKGDSGKIWENWNYIEPSTLANSPQGGQGVQAQPAQMPSPPVMPGQQAPAAAPAAAPQAAPAQPPVQQPAPQAAPPQPTQQPGAVPPQPQPTIQQGSPQPPQGQVPTVPGQPQ